jgi:SHAQKYF class myb-like DNA-binding protein
MERDDPKSYQYQQPYLDLTYGGSTHSEEQDEYNSDANEPSFGGSLMDNHHHNMYTDSQQPFGISANAGGSDEYEEDDDDEDDPPNHAIATVEHTGRWTREEHEAFLLGLQKYGKEWKKVAAQVRTRTVVQTRTHAQKYFQKLQKSLIDKQQSKRPHGSRTKSDDAEDDEDENDNEAMKMIALMSSQSGNMDSLVDYIPNVAAFTSSLSASGGRGSRGGRGGGGSKRNLAKERGTNHPQPLLPPPSVLPSVPLTRRGSTATMNAAQVISTLSSAKTNDNSTVTAVSSSHSVLPGVTTPSRFHGFSIGDEVNATPWQQSNAMKMKITAPDPSTQPRYPFPEPSPAATGKRKLAEIAAAQMLVGAISGGGGTKAARSSASSNLMFDGPPTPPMSANSASGVGGERHLHLKDAPPLPPLFSGGATTTGAKPSLYIVNPESLGVTVAATHHKGSPVTPWDGELEALIVQQSTNAATAAENDPDGMVDSYAAAATPALPAQHPNHSPVDGYNRNPLHQAVCAQDYSTVQTLLDVIGPQDLNQVDSVGYAPLHSACAARLTAAPGEPETHPNIIVRLLLGAGCNRLVTDPHGNTPLHWAVRSSDYDAAEQLLQQSSTDQSNPLSYVDRPNYSGETCLHWALRLGMRGSHISRLLLSFKACSHSLNKEFKRPVDVAAEGFLDDETSLAYALVQRQKKGSCNGGDTANNSNGNGDGRKKSQEKEWKELLRRTQSDRCATRAFFLQHSISSRTLVLHHPECLDHHPKSVSDWETPARVETILQRLQKTPSSDDSGNSICPYEIVLSQDFDRANLELLSRVHSTEYLSFVNQLSKELERKVMAKGISVTGGENDDAMNTKTSSTSSGIFSSTVVPFTPMVQRSMIKIDESSIKLSDNSDTSFSVGSLRAARRAAGAVHHAVDWYVVVSLDLFSVVFSADHYFFLYS